MDAGLGSWAADDADGLARTLARARVGLRALSADRQTAQVADAPITFDPLQALQVHADLTAKVALDHILTVLNRVNDLRKLLLSEILGANRRINIGLGQDIFRVG